MLIPNKLDGFVNGRRLYNFGGGDSQQAAPTSQTVTQTNIPDYARPYVEDMLGRSNALTTQSSYQPYGGQRVAGTTGLQNQAAGTAAGMGPAYQLNMATGIANSAAGRAASMGAYNPQTNFNPGYAPSQVGTNWGASGVSDYFNHDNVSATPGYQQTGTQNWNGQAAQQYMNPYMQQVVDIQKREAGRQSAMQGEMDNAGAVGAGAFGGSRNAIVQSERERNLGQLQNDIQSQGANAAWNQAQGMFTADQGRNLQSQMSNQNAGLTWGGQYLQGQMANQQAGLTNQSQRMQAQGMNQQRDLGLNAQNMQGQQANQQAGLQYNQQYLNAQQLSEQSRQYSNQAGLAGLNAQLSAAGLLSGIGAEQFGQSATTVGLQNQIGSQQQATNQAALDANYQNWTNQQMFPYRQLEFQNSMLHGNYSPQTTTSMYGGYGSPVSQMAGIGTAALGMSKLMAKGGEVQSEYPTYETDLPPEQDSDGKHVGAMTGSHGDLWPGHNRYAGSYQHPDFNNGNGYTIDNASDAGPGRGKVNPPRAKSKNKYANGGIVDVILASIK